MRNYLLFCLFLILQTSVAQHVPTSTEHVLQNLKKKSDMAESSLVKNLALENIGPSVMSGRVADLEVNPNDPSEFYVGYAAGGLWHTQNNGTTFVPIMDNAETQNIGDIAIDWKNGTIWVGTGENISSRSSYAGIGMLKSTDNGKTWQNVGLQDAHHFGRIVINPDNPEEAVVGVTGHLYSKNKERGIYKTTNGGKTWNQTLFIDDVTGIIDLAHAPNNFNIMYAAAWHKDRKAWDFTGNGATSGIYKSTDAGNSWTLISTSDSGFPTGDGVGRIGFAVFNDTTVYAVHDSQYRRKKDPTKDKKIQDGLTKDQFKDMSTEAFLQLKDEQLDTFLKSNRFPKKYDAGTLKQMVKTNKIKPSDLASYLENPNAQLFDTPVVGAELYRSDDAGKTWTKTHEGYIDDLYYSYGYVFAQVRVDPSNVDKLYLLGVPIIKSDDGGKTFTSIQAENVHVDHHSLWVNPKRPGHLINGNDGGLNITYDDGENWTKSNSESLGTFFAINVDHQEPYNVYGGLQDNGVWMGAHNAEENPRWHQTGQYPWKTIMGGDGMQIEIDKRNPNIVYTGYQFGNYFRIDLETSKRKYIQPQHDLGEPPYRFNWESPILLSQHNQDILYLGGNKLFRSLNQGDDWDSISEDLTQGGKKGNVPYGTLTTISESPFKFGLLYVGSDDGLVHISKNGGDVWENVSNSFPKDLWVSTVAASQHKQERVYATLSGYRWDDFTPYIYVSEDYGQTWKEISNNIPASPVNDLVEDPENENLLFAATDNGLYASFDRGDNWELFQNGMPNVAVHDLGQSNQKPKHLVDRHPWQKYL